MKLKTGFITHTLQGQQMMVAAGPAAKVFRGVIRSNETAAFIIDCLKTETTEPEITAKLCAEYDVSHERAAAGVSRVLEQLREIGAIE